MAQTAYLQSTGSSAAGISIGAVSRQWMTPQGIYINESISGAAIVSRPVMQVCG